MKLDLSKLKPERAALYKRVADQIGNTPLVRLDHLAIPNECKIFLKCEHQNPTGTVYDRMTLALLAGREGADPPLRIRPGDKLAETTTGSSGAAFAWLCRVLGYERPIVFIPTDMPAARIAQIRSYGAEVRLTPADKYIEGLVDDFSDWTHEAKSGEYRVPNHSKDTVWAPQAMADLARECLSQLQNYHHKSFDYFVGALGNGTSARGLSDGLPGGTKIIGVVPSERPHEVYGTSAGTEDVTFPNLEVVSRRLERTLEISSDAWRETFWELQDKEALHVGRSTALCVAAAKLVAAGAPRGSNILVLGYDAAWRYLELETAREGSDGSEPLNSITTKR